MEEEKGREGGREGKKKENGEREVLICWAIPMLHRLLDWPQHV